MGPEIRHPRHADVERPMFVTDLSLRVSAQWPGCLSSREAIEIGRGVLETGRTDYDSD